MGAGAGKKDLIHQAETLTGLSQLMLQRSLAHEVKAEGNNALYQACAGLQQDIQPFNRDHAANPDEHVAFDSDAEPAACFALVARCEKITIHAPGHHVQFLGSDAPTDKLTLQILANRDHSIGLLQDPRDTAPPPGLFGQLMYLGAAYDDDYGSVCPPRGPKGRFPIRVRPMTEHDIRLLSTKHGQKGRTHGKPVEPAVLVA